MVSSRFIKLFQATYMFLNVLISFYSVLWKKQAKLELSGYMEKEATGYVGFKNIASI